MIFFSIPFSGQCTTNLSIHTPSPEPQQRLAELTQEISRLQAQQHQNTAQDLEDALQDLCIEYSEIAYQERLRKKQNTP